MKNQFHKAILLRTNELAMRARGRTATNPNVGAVVFNSDNRILGEGMHQYFGGPHAEVNAIQKAKRHHSISGQSIAVSLEPCNHIGKTPACTTAIQDQLLSSVWVDQIDPDEKMSGQSMKLLRNAGLEVPPPLKSSIGKDVLYPFRINTTLKRPYLRLKMAVSADFYIGQPNKQVKISNSISDRWVHRLRSETQAIMTGTNTLINDDPSLTSRYGNRKQPIRILPDRRGILPGDLRVFTQKGENIVLTTSDRTNYRAKIIQVDPHDLTETFTFLFQHNVGSILIEGGTILFNSLFKSGLWDQLILVQNNDLYLHTGISAPDLPSFEKTQKIKLGSDTIYFINNLTAR